MNLTPLRVAALRLIRDTPGIYLGTLAERLVPRKWGWRAQGATRWGGAYAKPLVKAGLVRSDIYVRCGGAQLYLTEDGITAVQQADAADAAAAFESAVASGD